MTRRIPILPTLFVLCAVATMIGLGLWQYGKIAQKEALIASYRQAETMSADAPYPRTLREIVPVLYRHTVIACDSTHSPSAMSGKNAAGEAGQAHTIICVQPNGSEAKVVLGWSRDPAPVTWSGKSVAGIIAPGPRLVADPPQAGLEANARPDPSDIHNNHLSYTFQWFFFAATALLIYIIALRKRWREG